MPVIWRGHTQFSLVTIPIRIHHAIDTAQKIQSNLLSKETNNPVKYERWDKVTGDTLRLKSTKLIKTEGSVDAKKVHYSLFDAPYFVGRYGDVAGKIYALLSEALKKSGKINYLKCA